MTNYGNLDMFEDVLLLNINLLWHKITLTKITNPAGMQIIITYRPANNIPG